MLLSEMAGKALILLSLLSTCACAVFGSNAALQKDSAFRQGYQDGCAAATDQGSDLRHRIVADKQLYADDDSYRSGWGSGFHNCRRSELEPHAMPGENPVKLPGPGH